MPVGIPNSNAANVRSHACQTTVRLTWPVAKLSDFSTPISLRLRRTDITSVWISAAPARMAMIAASRPGWFFNNPMSDTVGGSPGNSKVVGNVRGGAKRRQLDRRHRRSRPCSSGCGCRASRSNPSASATARHWSAARPSSSTATPTTSSSNECDGSDGYLIEAVPSRPTSSMSIVCRPNATSSANQRCMPVDDRPERNVAEANGRPATSVAVLTGRSRSNQISHRPNSWDRRQPRLCLDLLPGTSQRRRPGYPSRRRMPRESQRGRRSWRRATTS